jgi:hypothetical protein
LDIRDISQLVSDEMGGKNEGIYSLRDLDGQDGAKDLYDEKMGHCDEAKDLYGGEKDPYDRIQDLKTGP